MPACVCARMRTCMCVRVRMCVHLFLLDNSGDICDLSKEVELSVVKVEGRTRETVLYLLHQSLQVIPYLLCNQIHTTLLAILSLHHQLTLSSCQILHKYNMHWKITVAIINPWKNASNQHTNDPPFPHTLEINWNRELNKLLQ